MADIIPLLMYDGSNKVQADNLVTEVTDAEWGEIQSKLPDEVTKDGFKDTYIAYLRGTKAEPLQVRAASNRLFVDRYVKIWREANVMAPMYLKFMFTPNDDAKPVSYRSATMNEVVLFLTDIEKIGAPEDTKTVQVVLDSVPDQRASWVSVGGIEYKITPREYTELLAEQKKEDKEWAQQKGELVIPGSPPRARRTLPRMDDPSLFRLPGSEIGAGLGGGSGGPPPEEEEDEDEDEDDLPGGYRIPTYDPSEHGGLSLEEYVAQLKTIKDVGTFIYDTVVKDNFQLLRADTATSKGEATRMTASEIKQGAGFTRKQLNAIALDLIATKGSEEEWTLHREDRWADVEYQLPGKGQVTREAIVADKNAVENVTYSLISLVELAEEDF